MWMSFSTSPSISLETGMPVHLATTSATSSSSTSSLRKVTPDCGGGQLGLALGELALELGDLAVAQLGRALEVGLALGALGVAVRLLEALLEPADRARSRPSPACQCAFISVERSRRSASSRSIASRRATDASSVSFSSAWRSISSCMMRRSTSSISVGIESISMRSREAASSIRSIALSGRKRSAM